jgi:hypothetical protein
MIGSLMIPQVKSTPGAVGSILLEIETSRAGNFPAMEEPARTDHQSRISPYGISRPISDNLHYSRQTKHQISELVNAE